MAKRIEEEARTFVGPDDVAGQVKEYLFVKKNIDQLDTRSKELRDKLFSHLDEGGYEDDKGNVQLELESEVDGVVRLEKQRRVTRKLNEPKADEILTELGLKDEIYVMTPVLDEDKLMAAFYEGKITEEQLDDMFPSTIVWALRTLKS
jgi:hypothetical protein